MTVESMLRVFGGLFVMISVALAYYVDARFLWFTLFVGANLFQSGFTGWCPMMAILRAAGVKDTAATR